MHIFLTIFPSVVYEQFSFLLTCFLQNVSTELSLKLLFLKTDFQVGVLTRMVKICRSMRCYLRGTSNSPLAQFSLSSEDGSDSGDCGGIPAFTFCSIASFGMCLKCHTCFLLEVLNYFYELVMNIFLMLLSSPKSF